MLNNKRKCVIYKIIHETPACFKDKTASDGHDKKCKLTQVEVNESARFFLTAIGFQELRV